jgi:hypothetical protein
MADLATANLFGNTVTMSILLTITLAIAVRTGGAFWEKLKKGEVTTFEPKYFATAITSFFVALTPAMAFLPDATILFNSYVNEYGIIFSLIIVGLSAYTVNHAVNWGVKKLESSVETNMLKPGGKVDKIIQDRIDEKFVTLKAAILGEVNESNESAPTTP